MRRDEHARGASTADGPGGSGSGSVTSSAARIRPAAACRTRAVGVDDPTACDVDQQSAVRHRREEAVVDQTGGALVQAGPPR